MKKKILSFCLCALCCFSCFGITTYAKSVTKSYRFDRNLFTGTVMNFHGYKYISVPAAAYLYNTHTSVVGSGWNYNRYQVTNIYKSGNTLY